ncbi:MAG: NUDIX domain-containing protein [Clostridiales bacterium]|nr:NUDIX domain-containing protein [Clostridiales bacterium]
MQEIRMEDSMELWDIYDKCFVKTGRLHERGKPLKEGDYHLVVHIYPINSKGQILIQKRTDTVSWKPGYWANTGGSAIAGDDAWLTCQKELWEELGIKATRENSSLAMTYRRNNSFCAVWLVQTDMSIEELTLQPTEVVEAKWVTREEIKSMGEKGLLVEYFYLDFLFYLIDEEFGTMWKSSTSNK